MSERPKLLAWVIQDEWGEGHARVIFARTEKRAQIMAAHGDIDGKPRRAPEFDRDAPGPVPVRRLLEEGWWFGCGGCSHRVTADGCDDCADEADLPVAADPFWKCGAVYCSRDCYAGEVQRRWDDRRRKRADRAAGRSAIERRWPGAVFVDAFRSTSERRAFSFTFPGGKYGTATLYTPGLAAHEKETLLVPQGDVDAWRAFEDSLLALRPGLPPTGSGEGGER